MVRSLLQDGDTLVASVHGTRKYKVRLRVNDGVPEGECSCPMGDAGVFCKHLVAVGLTYLRDGLSPESAAGGVESGSAKKTAGAKKAAGPRAKKPPSRPVTMDDIRDYLLRLEPTELVEMLVEQLHGDDHLRESLLLRVACERSGGFDAKAFRSAIAHATATHGFVDYHNAHDFVSGLYQVVSDLEGLAGTQHAAEAIALAEYATERCVDALQEMDDSDGYMGGILESLGEVHLKACVAARPDPKPLARRLFDLEMRDAFDTFFGSAERYAEVLGKEGLAEFRRLAQKEWAKVPERLPGGEAEPVRGVSYFRITSVMESLARASGDVEELVGVKARDLSSAWRFLQIAEVYEAAKLRHKALEWAEKGLRAFAKSHPDSRLEEYIANEYRRRGRCAEAMELVWLEFERQMDFRSFERLKGHAERDAVWPAWREKALAALRETLDKAAALKGQPLRAGRLGPIAHWGPGPSDLVQILVRDGDTETAWQEAKSRGCSDSLWLELAALREADHPADALEVYRRSIDPLVGHKQNDGYRRAAKHLRTIRSLMARLGREREFPPYLATVRAAHKPKRNFMAMIVDL